MKPFTFMTVVLGLILGFLFASSHTTAVPHRVRPRPPERPAFAQVRYVVDERDDDDEGGREEAEGLPVPIVPGTRVTEAEIKPPKRGRRAVEAKAPPRDRVAYQHSSTARSISGRLSATEDRARNDARLQLDREVTEWLTPDVPTQWKPPAHLIGRMIGKIDVQPIVRDYGTLYEATLDVDFSPDHRGEIVAAYHREVVARRLAILGGSLGFVLACLAALAGYIRADEATKGYYTHWLRAVAATRSHRV